MIPFLGSQQFSDLFLGRAASRSDLNADHIDKKGPARKIAKGSRMLRLLPGFLGRPLQDWLDAKAYEKSLIGLWEVSPHLLEDVGVVFDQQDDMPNYLVAPPPRVVAHLRAQGVLPPEDVTSHAADAAPAGPATARSRLVSVHG